jgi:hypothetical protein
MEFDYIELLGYQNDRRIGRVLNKCYTGGMSDKLKHKVPVLAVDGFSVVIKSGYEHQASLKTYKIPTADVLFTVDKGDEKEVVSAVRLTNHQIKQLIETLESKLTDFNNQNNPG